MIDRRVTDLSYGHLGEASYDADEGAWSFSRETALDYFIVPLQPLQQCIPASCTIPESAKERSGNVLYAQKKWLQKRAPETGPAAATISSVRKSLRAAPLAPQPSSLLAMGKATDSDHPSGRRAVQIVAMAHGEAGNVLRLIKPQVEGLGWNGQSGTNLQTLNPASSESCYWQGDGGAIQQISFAADTSALTSWMAVLKAESTTILRPIYHKDQTPSISTINFGTRYPPSRLIANPIVCLKAQETGARPHADVSFNPWYVRQFAIIDQQGFWSIWDIEGQKRKRTTFKAKPGTSGHIHDDQGSDQILESRHYGDGWARVMWVGNVNTLLMCNRRHFAIFDLRVTPKRLRSPELVSLSSTGWILDLKRSPVSQHHVFVLTTSQIFWLDIIPADHNHEAEDEHAGGTVLLSCRHFRNDEDETMRLEVFGENDGCNVLLYSSSNLLVHTYRFELSLDNSATPQCFQGSFLLELEDRDQTEKLCSSIQTLCLLPTSFMRHNLHQISGRAKEYDEHDISFFQVFGLSGALALSHTLCATRRIDLSNSDTAPRPHIEIVAPTFKRTTKKKSSTRLVEDDFIVPDGLDAADDTAEPSLTTLPNYEHHSTEENIIQEDPSTSIDAREIFEFAFHEKSESVLENATASDESQTMVEYIEKIQMAIEEKMEQGTQGLTTLFDLAGYTSFSEDVDDAASTLKEFMNFLDEIEDDGNSMAMKPTVIRPSVLFQPDNNDATSSRTMLNLSDIYDELIELWVSCLPSTTPGLVRLAKEKLVRGIAAELCLSSLAISIRDKSVVVPEAVDPDKEVDFVLPVRGKPGPTKQLGVHDSHWSSSAPAQSLPTPAVTPTLPSPGETATLSNNNEDEAISRLRGYALSIKSKPPLGTRNSAILAHWPAVPGGDPSKYSWEESRKAVAENEETDMDDEEAFFRQKEKDRRRRRTEKFLRRQVGKDESGNSQPAPEVVSGSQPDPVQPAFSSQTVEIPMTQPDRGAFGSRLGLKSSKRRRTRGF